MEWLTNLLGMANQGTSPFGALGRGSGGPSGPTGNIGFGQGVGASGPIPAAPMPGYGGPSGNIGFGTGIGANGPIPAAPAPAPTGTTPQFPGLVGKLISAMSGQQGGQNQQGQQTGNQPMTSQQMQLLNQAQSLIRGPQIQPVNWMHLLSGPRAQ